jgi:hypothetical protein
MREKEIRDLFARHGLPLEKDDIWTVQNNPVVRHRALERLAEGIQVEWQAPQVLRAERDEAVILVSGRVGKQLEWSIGEALIVRDGQPGGNYKVSGRQASYIWAMAEKRAKDRVILKLAGLQGVYSEEEADDFKSRDSEPSNEREKPPGPLSSPHISNQSRDVYVENSLERIAGFESAPDLLNWAKTERAKVWPQYGIDALDPDGQRIVKVYKDRMAVLEQAVAA